MGKWREPSERKKKGKGRGIRQENEKREGREA